MEFFYEDAARQCDLQCLFALQIRYWEHFTSHSLVPFFIFFRILLKKEDCDSSLVEIYFHDRNVSESLNQTI